MCCLLLHCHHCRVKASTYKSFLMENPDSLLRMIQVCVCECVCVCACVHVWVGVVGVCV